MDSLKIHISHVYLLSNSYSAADFFLYDNSA